MTTLPERLRASAHSLRELPSASLRISFIKTINKMAADRIARELEEAAQALEGADGGKTGDEAAITLEEIEALARTMWKGEPVPGRVLRFGAAVLGLADAARTAGVKET